MQLGIGIRSIFIFVHNPAGPRPFLTTVPRPFLTTVIENQGPFCTNLLLVRFVEELTTLASGRPVTLPGCPVRPFTIPVLVIATTKEIPNWITGL
uniref:Uncharacterized protein n=1 Tax=Rhizophora mucronata TaxID=61149 RepID=A0A2P2LNP6_RHIMU